jgi:hypothetical protein
LNRGYPGSSPDWTRLKKALKARFTLRTTSVEPGNGHYLAQI